MHPRLTRFLLLLSLTLGLTACAKQEGRQEPATPPPSAASPDKATPPKPKPPAEGKEDSKQTPNSAGATASDKAKADEADRADKTPKGEEAKPAKDKKGGGGNGVGGFGKGATTGQPSPPGEDPAKRGERINIIRGSDEAKPAAGDKEPGKDGKYREDFGVEQ